MPSWVFCKLVRRRGAVRYGVDFRASTDDTGNSFRGGDWKMETDGDYDVAPDYLDAAELKAYTATMGCGMSSMAGEELPSIASVMGELEALETVEAACAFMKSKMPTFVAALDHRFCDDSTLADKYFKNSIKTCTNCGLTAEVVCAMFVGENRACGSGPGSIHAHAARFTSMVSSANRLSWNDNYAKFDVEDETRGFMRCAMYCTLGGHSFAVLKETTSGPATYGIFQSDAAKTSMFPQIDREIRANGPHRTARKACCRTFCGSKDQMNECINDVIALYKSMNDRDGRLFGVLLTGPTVSSAPPAAAFERFRPPAQLDSTERQARVGGGRPNARQRAYVEDADEKR